MKKFVLFIIVAIIAAGLAFGPSLLAQFNAQGAAAMPGGGPGVPGGRPGGPGGPGGPGMPGMAGATNAVFTVRVAEAEIRSLQAYTEVNGDIVSAQQVAVVPDSAGKLVSMKAELGSRVIRGALVAEVDPSRPGSQYSHSPVYAPVSGVVVSSPVPEGSTVSTATTLFTIAVGEVIEIEALIPEREVGQLRAGLGAEAYLEAFPGEVFPAELIRLSPVVDPVSRTKKVVLRFARDDPRVNPGMFARIKLNTRAYDDVVSIPQEAIVENRGTTVVYVLDSNTVGEATRVTMREVAVGVSIDGETEIKDGLAAGEQVVVQGQQFLNDGATVRVLGTRS
jgi:multidrug efflux pump subunit AcrA (membrane-fusion protein)